MATGIDWEHPEIQKGLALFEELFRDRLYPPEVPEEVPEPGTPPRREVPYLPDISPMKIKTPPPKWWSFKVDPPKWLTHSMDRDLFAQQAHPEWYSRFWDETYPQSPIKPPYPPSPGPSPPFWDISEILELEPAGDKSDVFMSPRPPSPPKELEPPLPDLQHDPSVPVSSYAMALHQMYWELQKYEHDKEYIVKYVRTAPLVRDVQILTKELEALVKLYIPDVDADNMGPLVAFKALEDYIVMTEEKIEERYGEPYAYKYPDITEEVLAAQVRLHKQKALDAIDTYKRGYFFLLKELEKAEIELALAIQNMEANNAVHKELQEEINRLKTEEQAEDKKYLALQERRHLLNCPFKPQFEAAFQRNIELQKLIPQLRQEMERTKEAHEREVKNMANWLNLFPPKFVDRLQWLVSNSITMEGYKPVPMDRYMEFLGDLETDIQTLKNSRESDLRSVSHECGALGELVDQEMAKMEEMKRITNELLEEQSILSAELNSLRLEGQNRSELWAKLREEHIYYKEYNEMLLGKIIALHAEASVESEDLLAIGGPKSRSPSPVGIAPAEPSPASPPAFGSETFSISQIESSPRFDESPDLLGQQRPPSEMLDISDLSGSRGSPAHESIHQDQDSLDEEQPPSGMQNLSDLPGSGGSPVHESPQGQALSDDLDEERPPSGMDFSDLSASGGAPAHESPQGQALSDDLGDERPPSGMLDFSGLQGGESFLDSLEDSASPGKQTFLIPSPDKAEQLRMNVEIIPQDIRRSPSGQRVVCDVALQMQEAALRPPRRIENRYKVVRGSPPISQTVGRRVDRRHRMFTPRSVIKRGHIGVRRPLFAEDFESPESPFGTGRMTHPELMNLPERAPSPRPPNLDTTMDWELLDLT